MHILSLEDWVSGYVNLNEEISSRSAINSRFSFFTDAYALSVIDTCRNRNFDLLSAGCISCTCTFRTFLFHDLTGTTTVRTRLYILYGSKEGLGCIYDLTFTAALWTCLR